VEPRSRASFHSLETYGRLGARLPGIWEYPSADPALPVSRTRLFRGEGEINAVVGDMAYGYDVGDGHAPNSCEI
jgi:hypothetical protein